MQCVLSGHIRGTSVQLVRSGRFSGLLLIRGFRVRAPDAPPTLTCRNSSRLTCRGGLAWNDSIRCFNAHSAPNAHLLRTDSNRVAGDDGARRCALAIEPTRSRGPGELEPSGLRSPRRLGKPRRRWVGVSLTPQSGMTPVGSDALVAPWTVGPGLRGSRRGRKRFARARFYLQISVSAGDSHRLRPGAVVPTTPACHDNH